MSGSTTATVTPPPAKNDYFTFTGGHRDPIQVWNVAATDTDGKTAVSLEIYVQGDLTGKGFLRSDGTALNSTSFAKKHLLTFKGGRADGAKEDISAKMGRILDKRQFAGVSNNQRKDTTKIADLALRAKTDRVIAKYSPTKAPANTFIVCDDLTAAELKLRFANALLKGNDTTGDAVVYLPAGSVRTMDAGKALTNMAADSTKEVPVHVGYSRIAGTRKYAINHLEANPSAPSTTTT